MIIKYNYKSAFDLVDVLLVVGIIGMVALVLIPVLNMNYKQMTTEAKLIKSYATVANAFNMAISLNGSPDNWGLTDSGDPTGLPNLNRILSENMTVAKNCGTAPGCFSNANYKDLKGLENPEILNESNNYTKILLPDGTSMAFTNWASNCDIVWGENSGLNNVCGMIGIDINGVNAPNKYGEDYFGFVLTKNGIVPMGTQNQEKYPSEQYCNIYSTNTNFENGLSCTAQVIYDGRICSGKNDDNNDNNGKNNKNFKNGNDNDGNNGNNNCNGNY